MTLLPSDVLLILEVARDDMAERCESLSDFFFGVVTDTDPNGDCATLLHQVDGYLSTLRNEVEGGADLDPDPATFRRATRVVLPMLREYIESPSLLERFASEVVEKTAGEAAKVGIGIGAVAVPLLGFLVLRR